VLFLMDQGLLAMSFAGTLAIHEAWFHEAAPPEPAAAARLWFVTAGLTALAFSSAGLYRLPVERPDMRIAGALHILWGGLLSMASILAADLLARPLDGAAVSRGMGFLYAALATPSLAVSRLLLGVAVRRLGDNQPGATVVVFGMSRRVLRLLASFQRGPQLHLEIVGVVADSVPSDLAPRLTMVQALELLEQGQVDHVLVESEEFAQPQMDRIMSLADQEGISAHIVSPIFPATNLLPTWERVAGVPVLGFVTAELPLGARLAKRAFDIVVSAAGLAVLALPLAIIALLVKLTSPGPAFYVQRRVGQQGRIFSMLKFRSMDLGAEDESGPVWAVEDDPRCTRFGHLLRRTNMDELPQLVNVLLGHMSLVGPRPERPEFVKGFKRKIPRYAHKHWVKPGITGWAQIHGLRGNTSLTDRVEHDLYYVENWSLMLDVRILVRTVFDRYLSAA
jgi:exopolysaccharide biosynthesis polyprenyl glycosylphosphotransferase